MLDPINKVKVFFKYENKPEKVQSPVPKIVVYDIETFNKILVVPYCSCLYETSKNSGKYNSDVSEQENQKYLNDCVAFKGTDCFNEI